MSSRDTPMDVPYPLWTFTDHIPPAAQRVVVVFPRDDKTDYGPGRVNIKRYIGIITDVAAVAARTAKWPEGLKDPIKPAAAAVFTCDRQTAAFTHILARSRLTFTPRVWRPRLKGNERPGARPTFSLARTGAQEEKGTYSLLHGGNDQWPAERSRGVLMREWER